MSIDIVVFTTAILFGSFVIAMALFMDTILKQLPNDSYLYNLWFELNHPRRDTWIGDIT